MTAKNFIHSLTRPWLLSPRYATEMAMYAYLIRSGKMELSGSFFQVQSGERRGEQYVVVPESEHGPGGKVAIHYMEGPLMRDDQFCGPAGMITMADRFTEIDQSGEYIAHIMRAHTPGGSVEGTEYYAQAIENRTLPLVVHGEEIFSGGVYLTASADHIKLIGRNSAMGSVGVQVSYLSFKRAMEDRGIDKVILRASTSPDKNRFDWDALSEEDRTAIQTEMLDPIDQHFMSYVRAHRTNIAEEALTGKEYFAEDAIRLGLADSIGTFQEAVHLAAKLGNESKSNRKMKVHTKTEPSQEVEAPQEQITSTPTDEQNRIAEMAKVIESKDAIIASQKALIEAQSKTIDQLSALPSVDPEQAIVSPTSDTQASQTQLSAPPEVLAAIEHTRKREAILKNQQQTDIE